jgi:hypothetical protein
MSMTQLQIAASVVGIRIDVVEVEVLLLVQLVLRIFVVT